MTGQNLSVTGTFGGASGTGQPHPEDSIYGLSLEPLPPQSHGVHAMPAPDWAHDTMPGFPAITADTHPAPPLIPPCRCEQCEWAVQVAGGYDGQCRCDACKYGRRPGAGVVLYSRPGSADLLWALDVRDGRYEDIEGLFDGAWRRSRQGFEAASRNVRRNFTIARHRVWSAAGAERAA